MKRTWLPVLLLACAAPVFAWAAPPDASGVYLVDFHVRLGSAVPDGALVTCRVRIAPGAQVVAAAATVRGSVAHCAVEIPAAWADARSAATLSYEIDAASPAGAPMLQRTATGEGVSLPRPPAGGAARLDLSLSL